MPTPQQHTQEFMKNQRRQSVQFMRRVMELVRNRVVKKLTGEVLNRQTGRLVSSIATRVNNEHGVTIGTIGTNVWYGAAWETTGMKAHDVKAVNAKALKIPVALGVRFAQMKTGGMRTYRAAGRDKFIFRKKVHIPYQPPRPFLKPSITESHGVITALHQEYFGTLFPKSPIIVKLPPIVS